MRFDFKAGIRPQNQAGFQRAGKRRGRSPGPKSGLKVRPDFGARRAGLGRHVAHDLGPALAPKAALWGGQAEAGMRDYDRAHE